jgi:hypothetical protein
MQSVETAGRTNCSLIFKILRALRRPLVVLAMRTLIVE